MTAILEITNGTTTIDLIHGSFGFALFDWRPSIADYKGGGVWQGSSISEGRQLVDKHFDNAIETFDLKARNSSQDVLIQNVQDLRRMLEDAADYWTEAYNSTPVYIIAKASQETNTRYAVIKRGRLVDDDGPFRQPFLQPKCRAAMDNLTLIVERGHWQDVVPGEDTCVEITASDSMAVVYPLEFDGDSGEVDCGTDASLDDLPDEAVAGKGIIWVDGWILPSSAGENDQGRIVAKGSNAVDGDGFTIYVTADGGLCCRINCATQDAIAISGADEFDPENTTEFTYFAMAYSETGAGLPAARTIYLNIGGAWVTSYTTQQVSTGNYATDADDSWIIGNNGIGTRTFDGLIGWLRVLNVILHSPADGDFTAPPRCPLPDYAVSTLGLWIHEGEGSTAYNVANVGTSDGTITDAEWGDPCERTYGFTGDDCYGYTEYDDGPFVPLIAQDDSFVDSVQPGVGGGIQFGNDATPPGRVLSAHIRFRNVSVPAGARILRAFVRGYASQNENGTDCNILIQGEKTGVPGEVSISYADYLSRAKTIEGVDWVVPAHVNGNSYDTPDISAVIQEVIDLPNWASGNNLAVFLSDDGSDSDAWRNWDYAGGTGSGPPELHLEWAVEGSDGDCDCDEVSSFVANKQNTAQLTHIYHYDDSTATYSGNLLGAATPFNLLPTTPGNNDIIYFGIDTTLVDSGPFCSLIFDLATAATYGAGDSGTWEYYQGAPASAWATLTTRDNTATAQPLDTIGVNSVHWRQEYDSVAGSWDTTTINGVTAYWVRLKITVATAVTVPIQQNRDIYTITWPYFEIANDVIGGDIHALARIIYENVSGGTGVTDLRSQRLIMGARRVSRGDDFASFINISDEQLPTGVTVALNNFAFTNIISAVTGRPALYNIPPAGIGTIQITMDSTVANQYAGRYRFFIRVHTPSSGAVDNVDITYEVWMASDHAVFSSDIFRIPDNAASAEDWVLVDLGELKLPGTLDTPSRTAIEISFENTDAVITYPVYVMDAILIPVDEWSAEVKSPSASYFHLDGDTYLDLNSTRNPKLNIRAAARAAADDEVEAYWLPIAGAPVEVRDSTNLRIHILSALLSGGIVTDLSLCEEAGRPTLQATQRYLSMRGKR